MPEFTLPPSFSFRPTARSIVLLVVAVAFFATVVRNDSDILASIFVAVLAVIIPLFYLSCFLAARKAAAAIKVDCWFSSAKSFSLVPILLNCSLTNVSLFPLLRLLIRPLCREKPDMSFAFFDVQGGRRESLLQQTVLFPHRGNWAVDNLSFQCMDVLGLTVARWQSASEAKIEVAPPAAVLPDWPILVSSTRAGSSVEHIEHRQGDYLDLKPYHPSDGSRRIVWRLFAKTKELVARQPERSVDPEGECYLYAFVGTSDDLAAHHALDYANRLVEQECDVLFSCLGSDGKLYLSEFEAALIQHAFAAAPSARCKNELGAFLNAITQQSQQSPIVKVIIIIGESIFQAPSFDSILEGIDELFASQNISPHFLLNTSGSKGRGKVLEKNSATFFKLCAERGWEVSY